MGVPGMLKADVGGQSYLGEVLTNGAEFCPEPGRIYSVGTNDSSDVRLEQQERVGDSHASFGVVNDTDGHTSLYLRSSEMAGSGNAGVQIGLGNQVSDISDTNWYHVPAYSVVMVGSVRFVVTPAKTAEGSIQYKLVRNDESEPNLAREMRVVRSFYEECRARGWIEHDAPLVSPTQGTTLAPNDIQTNIDSMLGAVRSIFRPKSVVSVGYVEAISPAAKLAKAIEMASAITRGSKLMVAELLLNNGFAITTLTGQVINEFSEETKPIIGGLSENEIIMAITNPIPRRASVRDIKALNGNVRLDFDRVERKLINDVTTLFEVEESPTNGVLPLELEHGVDPTKAARFVGGFTEEYRSRHENQDRAYVHLAIDGSIKIGLLDVSGGALESEKVVVPAGFSSDRLLRRFGNRFARVMHDVLNHSGNPRNALFRAHDVISRQKRGKGFISDPEEFPGYGVANALTVSAPDSKNARVVEYAHSGDSPIVKFSPTRKFAQKRAYEQDRVNTPGGHNFQLMTQPQNIAEAFRKARVKGLNLNTVDFEASQAANQIEQGALLGGRESFEVPDFENAGFKLQADEMLIIGSDGIRINDWLAEKEGESGEYAKPYANEIHAILVRACRVPESTDYLSPSQAAEEIKMILRKNGEHDDITIIIVPPIHRIN